MREIELLSPSHFPAFAVLQIGLQIKVNKNCIWQCSAVEVQGNPINEWFHSFVRWKLNQWVDSTFNFSYATNMQTVNHDSGLPCNASIYEFEIRWMDALSLKKVRFSRRPPFLSTHFGHLSRPSFPETKLAVQRCMTDHPSRLSSFLLLQRTKIALKKPTD